MKNESVIAAVIALLNGIDVDGETMEYIINNTNMREQMISQLTTQDTAPDLGVVQDYDNGPSMTSTQISELADEIATGLINKGIDIIEDYEVELGYHREVSLSSVTLDEDVIVDKVLDILSDYISSVD